MTTLRKSFRFIALICAGSLGVPQPIPDRGRQALAAGNGEASFSRSRTFALRTLQRAETRPVRLAGLEETAELKHPFLTAVEKRLDRVRAFAERARDANVDIGFSPQEVDLLRTPFWAPFKATVEWDLDDGRIINVQITRIKHRSDPEHNIVGKGGWRSILYPFQTNSPASEAVWAEFLARHPHATQGDAQQFLEKMGSDIGLSLAIVMSLKLALLQLDDKMGGAKGDALALYVDSQLRIVSPKANYSAAEIMRLARGVGRVLAENDQIGPDLDVLAGDVGTDAVFIQYMAEEHLLHQARTPGSLLWFQSPELAKILQPLVDSSTATETPLLARAVRYANEKEYETHGEIPPAVLATYTSKPLELAGSEGRGDANGRQAVIVAEAMVRRIRRDRSGFASPLDGLTAAVQGFGQVGEPVARHLIRAGAHVIDISDHPDYYMELPSGFTKRDLEIMLQYKREVRRAIGTRRDVGKLKRRGMSKFLRSFPRSAGLLTLQVDLLFLGAMELAITESNANQIRAEFIFPIANGGVTPEAVVILAKKGKQVAPDTLASGGGVTVSGFEMKQNRADERWTEKKVYNELQDVTEEAFGHLWKQWEEWRRLDPDLDLFTAGDILAVQRLAQRYRGIAPAAVSAGLEEGDAAAIDGAMELAKRSYQWNDSELLSLKEFLAGKRSAAEAVKMVVEDPMADLPRWGDRGRDTPVKPLYEDDLPKQEEMKHHNAIAFLGALWVAARYRLSFTRLQLLQSFLAGTATPTELWRRFSLEGGSGNPPFSWFEFERMLAEGLRVQIWAGEAESARKNWETLLPGIRRLRREKALMISPETEDLIWHGWLADPSKYERAWEFSKPVRVQPTESVDRLPGWKSNVLPSPSAEGEISNSIFEGEGRTWEGYLSVEVENLIPPEFSDPSVRPLFVSLLTSGDFLGADDVPPERRKELALILDRHVQLWGHYWVPSSNGSGPQEMKVKLRPIHIQQVGSTLRVRFQAQIPADQPIRSPFVGEVILGDRHYGLSLNEQKAEVRILSPPGTTGAVPISRVKQFVSGGRMVGVVLGGKVRSVPMERQELLSNLAHEALNRAASSGESVLLFGNFGSAEDTTTARIDPGPLTDLMPADYVNTAIQWTAVDPEGVSLGIRPGSAAAFVFEGRQSNLQKVLDRAEKTIEALAGGDSPLTHYAVKVEAQPNGLFRLFLAPRNPKTFGPGWTVLAEQLFYAVEFFPGQAGLATGQQLQEYGFRKMTNHPSKQGQKIDGPLIRSGDPLMAEPLDALALHGGILREPSIEAFDDAFFHHRVRLAMARAGLASTDLRLTAQVARWQAEKHEKPDEAAGRRMKILVDQLEPQATLETLIKVMEEIRDGGSRLRFEAGFRQLPPSRQLEFNRQVWEMVQRFVREAPDRVRLEPVFPPAEAVSSTAGEGRGIVAAGFGSTWDVGIRVMKPVSSGALKSLTVRYKVGGPIAHILQAVQRLDPASTNQFFGSFGGSLGEAARESLGSQGIVVHDGLQDSELRPVVVVGRDTDEVRFVPRDSGERVDWAGPIRSGRRAAVESNSPWLIGGRFSDSPAQQAEIAKILSEEIREAVRAGVQVYLSIHPSWQPDTIRKILEASPQNVFLSWEDLARLFPAENPTALREDSWKTAALADTIRIRYNLSGAVLVSLSTAGFILAEAKQWYAVPPSEFWISYTTGATDSSFGVFLSARRRGDSPLDALRQTAGAYAVYRGRPRRERGLPPTREEIVHGPIPRVQPIPNRLANILEELGPFPSAGQAASLWAWWEKVEPKLTPLLDEAISSPSERAKVFQYLFQLETGDSSYPLSAIPLRHLLLQAMADPHLEVREVARQQWLKRERGVWLPLVKTVRAAAPGTVYRVEYDPSLLKNYDDEGELKPIKNALREAVQAAGGTVEFDWFNPSRKTEAGERRVLILTPEHAREYKPESSYRVLPMKWINRPEETRLLSRAFVLALTIASLPENPAPNEKGMVEVQRYFRFLGVSLSLEELRDYFSKEIADDRWPALVDRFTLNLSANPLTPLLDIKFNSPDGDSFLTQFAADLSV